MTEKKGLSMQRMALTITGQVQGVGFRPYIYRLAREENLTGFVLNDSNGVRIEVQGSPRQVSGFMNRLRPELPPLARIVSLTVDEIPLLDSQETDFSIHTSQAGDSHCVLISPDVATCPDCLHDIFNPQNRRFHYPFTNCTNCGPRFTITAHIPYDRPSTSMACFPLCPECRQEYENPLDRRFHAQPNACARCGPHIWLQTAKDQIAENDQALEQTAQFLIQGKIMAIKGLGGFHLACDAMNPKAVSDLRERKNRRDKPLAVMVADLPTARRYCRISPAEKTLLNGIERPIVLLQRKKGESDLPENLAPDTNFLGLMLPYTPLHHLLLDRIRTLAGIEHPALVMTSGNMSSEPICLGNREALQRLRCIADAFLLHNRDILIRCDDSVVRMVDERPLFMRRARGYTPQPVFLPDGGPSVFGTGPELKTTLCVTKNDQAFVSQHIGDMANLETLGFYRETAEHLPDILQCRPEMQVRDLHPDYMTSTYADERGQLLSTLTLQHHKAHVWACMAENKIDSPCLGIALDGTGLGEDGTLWGGELFAAYPAEARCDRIGRMARIPLAGGEQAILEPWRTARAFIRDLGLDSTTERIAWPWLPEFSAADRIVQTMLERKINTPLSSSCGRLFDAVAAVLGLVTTISYEGQGAIRLENIQDHGSELGDLYECPLRPDGNLMVLDTKKLFAQVCRDWLTKINAGIIAARFHQSLARGIADWALDAAQKTGLKTVVLSGGVLQNATLAALLPAELRQKGLSPALHVQIPPNDACISLGQAWYGLCVLRRKKNEQVDYV